MPLLKIFSRKALTVSADTLHSRLTKIWKVPNDVLKVLIIPTHDMSSSSVASSTSSSDGADDNCENNDLNLDSLYVDIRAKAKPERTKDAVSYTHLTLPTNDLV